MRPAIRTLAQVIAACEAERRQDRIVQRFGQCLGTSRQLYGIPTLGIRDASDAYRATPGVRTGTPPAGSHVLWTGGSRGDGHSSISAGGGFVYTVDIGGGAKLYKASIARINSAWGNLNYKGWAGNYAGVYDLAIAGEPVDLPNVSLRRVLAAQRNEQNAPRAVIGYPAAKLVEQSLAKLGHGSGPADGHLGTGFTDGVRSFQKSVGDKADGVLGPKQFARLAKAAGLFDAVA